MSTGGSLTALPKGWLPQLVFSDTRAYLWYLVLLVLSVLRKNVDRWTSQGMTTAIDPLGKSETGKKRTLEQNGDYCQRFVYMVASSELDWC